MNLKEPRIPQEKRARLMDVLGNKQTVLNRPDPLALKDEVAPAPIPKAASLIGS